MLKELFGFEPRSTLLDAAFRDVREMLEQSHRMLDHSLAALLDNQPLDVDLDNMDDVVDEGERMVRRSVLQHLTFNPEQDLVASLVLVSMVQDAERVGDSARGLAELMPLAKGPRGGEFAEALHAVAARLKPLFDLTVQAFRDDDVATAQRVVSEATQIKEDSKALTRRVADSDLSADMAVVYSGASRILRRVGSHLSNIASTVVQPYDRMRHGNGENEGDEDA